MSDDAALWEPIAAAGIQMLRIPTPFAVGRVNCFVLEDEPLTLVDTGPRSVKALAELEHQLEAVGHSIADIELIVITHQHLDHFGLVQSVVERSGAEVAGIDLLVDYVADYEASAEADDAAAASLMLRHGISDDIVTALRQVTKSFRGYGQSATVTRPLSDGETLKLRDRALEVGLRPGHSPSDTVFWDGSSSILIAGDHLIRHISSNPLVSRPLDGRAGRYQALASYLESMQRTRALPAAVVLAGHGEPVPNHAELIERRFDMHQRRAEKLYGLIASGPRTGHGMAHELWGDVAVTQAFLTLSEVLGHIDLLMNAGFVRESDDGELIRYEATGDADASELGDLIPGGNPSRREG